MVLLLAKSPVSKRKKYPQVESLVWWCTPIISATQEVEVGGTQSRLAGEGDGGGGGRNKRPSQKQDKVKRAEGMTQVREHLPSKREAPSSIPSSIR
jgi:hypothetical protein